MLRSSFVRTAVAVVPLLVVACGASDRAKRAAGDSGTDGGEGGASGGRTGSGGKGGASGGGASDGGSANGAGGSASGGAGSGAGGGSADGGPDSSVGAGGSAGEGGLATRCDPYVVVGPTNDVDTADFPILYAGPDAPMLVTWGVPPRTSFARTYDGANLGTIATLF